MTVGEAILELRETLTKNNIHDNTGYDNIRSVRLLNKAQNLVVEYLLDKRNEDDIRLIEQLLNTVDLKPSKTDSLFVNFNLPTDFFDFENLIIVGEKGKCKATDFIVFEEKAANIHLISNDENLKPSFEFRETSYIIGDNKIKILTSDFEIPKITLIYYRKPRLISIEGYEDVNGNPTSNVNPEFNDRLLYKIIDVAAMLADSNTGNLNKIQVYLQRIRE